MIKDQIEELLRSTGREGTENLLDYMDINGFFTAPCSTQYHLNHEGGLAEHSLNVYNTMVRFYNSQSEFTTLGDSIKVVSLLHDLGKMGHHGKPNYIPNILKSGKISDSKPYETNKDLLSVPHEAESILIAKQFIELTEEEEFAIYFHNGLYVPSGRELQGKERPLQMLLHFSDLWCSRVIEKEE